VLELAIRWWLPSAPSRRPGVGVKVERPWTNDLDTDEDRHIIGGG